MGLASCGRSLQVGMGKGVAQIRVGMLVLLVLCFSSSTLALHPNFTDTIWDRSKPHAFIELNGTTATQWNFTVEFDSFVMAFNPVRPSSQHNPHGNSQDLQLGTHPAWAIMVHLSS
jgi:hypothetical protein